MKFATKKVISMLMSALMLLGTVPSSAFAGEVISANELSVSEETQITETFSGDEEVIAKEDFDAEEVVAKEAFDEEEQEVISDEDEEDQTEALGASLPKITGLHWTKEDGYDVLKWNAVPNADHYEVKLLTWGGATETVAFINEDNRKSYLSFSRKDLNHSDFGLYYLVDENSFNADKFISEGGHHFSAQFMKNGYAYLAGHVAAFDENDNFITARTYTFEEDKVLEKAQIPFLSRTSRVWVDYYTAHWMPVADATRYEVVCRVFNGIVATKWTAGTEIDIKDVVDSCSLEHLELKVSVRPLDDTWKHTIPGVTHSPECDYIGGKPEFISGIRFDKNTGLVTWDKPERYSQEEIRYIVQRFEIDERGYEIPYRNDYTTEERYSLRGFEAGSKIYLKIYVTDLFNSEKLVTYTPEYYIGAIVETAAKDDTSIQIEKSVLGIGETTTFTVKDPMGGHITDVYLDGDATLTQLSLNSYEISEANGIVKINVKTEHGSYSGTCGTGNTWRYYPGLKMLQINGDGEIPREAGETCGWGYLNDRIEKVVVSDGIKGIGYHAFYGMPNLESVRIPFSCTKVGTEIAYADEYGSNSVDLIYEGSEVDWENANGVSLNLNLDHVGNWNPGGKCGDNVYWTILNLWNDSVTDTMVIHGTGAMYDLSSKSAWADFRKYETVIVEDGVTRIGENAFATGTYRPVLKKLIIADSVTSIGHNAFSYTTISEGVQLPAGLKSIDDSDVFYECKFKEIVIPAGTQYIGETTFAESSLETITIPNSVKRIGDGVFVMSDLKTIYYEGTRAQWDAIEGMTAEKNPTLFYDGVNIICINTATVAKKPEGRGGQWTGEEMPLVTAGEAINGTIYYRLGESGAFSTQIPTVSDEGIYKVYYMAKGNDGVEDSEVDFVEVTITGRIPKLERPVLKTNVYYDGEPVALLNEGSSEHGTFMYKLLDSQGNVISDYSEIQPRVEAAGDYTIYYKLVPNEHYIDLGEFFFNCHVYSANELMFDNFASEYNYSGKKVTPKVIIKCAGKTLKEGTDYKISYKNNVKICDKDATDSKGNKIGPCIIVKGTGAYTGTVLKYFTIRPKSLGTAVLPDRFEKYTGQPVKFDKTAHPYIKETYTEGVDYDVEYIQDMSNSANVSQAVQVGSYVVRLKFKGKYTGDFYYKLVISDKEDIRRVKFGKIGPQPYTGSARRPAFDVSFGKTSLVEGQDYTCSYSQNINCGTATIKVTGKGNYFGEKTLLFKIVPGKDNDLKKAIVTTTPVVYSGDSKQPVASVELNGLQLNRGSDYVVESSDFYNAGTRNFVIRGIGRYCGTKTVKATILPYEIKQDMVSGSFDSELTFVDADNEIIAKYSKNGATIKPVLFSRKFERFLALGTDYDVACKDNKEVASYTDSKAPTVVITFKGNFKGQITQAYTIQQENMGNVKIYFETVPYSTRPGAWKQLKATVVDSSGNLLKAGVDYESEFEYFKDNCITPFTDADVFDGCSVVVRITGKGNYTGTKVGGYLVGKTSLSKATVKLINKQYYRDGKAVEPKASDFEVIVDGRTLAPVTDYDIEFASVKNNYEKGTATVTLEGNGDYYGRKVVTFKIDSKIIQ